MGGPGGTSEVPTGVGQQPDVSPIAATPAPVEGVQSASGARQPDTSVFQPAAGEPGVNPVILGQPGEAGQVLATPSGGPVAEATALLHDMNASVTADANQTQEAADLLHGMNQAIATDASAATSATEAGQSEAGEVLDKTTDTEANGMPESPEARAALETLARIIKGYEDRARIGIRTEIPITRGEPSAASPTAAEAQPEATEAPAEATAAPAETSPTPPPSNPAPGV